MRLITVYLWLNVQSCRQTSHLCLTACSLQVVANNILCSVTHLPQNKYYIYNLNAAGNCKSLQLKSELAY